MRKVAFLASVLAALSLQGCQSEKQETEAPVKFAVTSPLKRTTALEREYVAKVRAIQHVEIRALEKGYLQDTYVDEGKPITRGQKMFQIQPVLYQAEALKAKAELDRAQVEYSNAQMLASKNVVSKNELAMAKANFDKASAELMLANTHRDFTLIKAPFDGTMGQLQVRKGSLLDEGDTLTTLSDNSSVWVYFNLSESEYLDLASSREGKEPTRVKLKMANGQVFRYPGKVETIIADFNTESGTIPCRATFPNPNHLLRHGETGKVLMEIPVRDALLIPKMAAFDVLEKKYV